MAASYDRELIAQMLEGARRGDLHQFSVESIERAISQLRAADNADAAGVHTARRLPPDGIHTCSYQCDQPECIRAQRDDLAAQAERDAAEIVRLRGEVEGMRHEAVEAPAEAFDPSIHPIPGEGQQPAACRCVDCGGDQPGHDPHCANMREIHGTQPQEADR